MADKVVNQQRLRDLGGGVFAPEVTIGMPAGSSVPVQSATPLPADVLGGTGGGGQTILTVPAGRTWKGSLSLSVSVSAAVGAAGGPQTCGLDLTGAGATPAAGRIVQVTVVLPTTTATATAGAAGDNAAHLSDVVIVAGAGAPAVLAVTGSASGTARGVLIG